MKNKNACDSTVLKVPWRIFTLPKYVSLDHRYEEQHVVEFNLLDAELLEVREERNLLREDAILLKEETNLLTDRLKKVQAPSSDDTEVKEIELHQKELLEQAEKERRALGRRRKFTVNFLLRKK